MSTTLANIVRDYNRLLKDFVQYFKTGFKRKENGGFTLKDERAETSHGKNRTKDELISKINKEIFQCKRCVLHEKRMNTVSGEGSISADIIFVGEGPGETEDIQGRPFVGRAGELLTRMLASIGLKREEVYITNIVKCRPPNNRNPQPDEVSSCFPYLEQQIEVIDPLIICCLGGPAAKAITGSNQGITTMRGTFHRYRNIPVLPTYHPAAVLRFPERYKRAVWNDLKMLRDFYKDIRGQQQ